MDQLRNRCFRLGPSITCKIYLDYGQVVPFGRHLFAATSRQFPQTRMLYFPLWNPAARPQGSISSLLAPILATGPARLIEGCRPNLADFGDPDWKLVHFEQLGQSSGIGARVRRSLYFSVASSVAMVLRVLGRAAIVAGLVALRLQAAPPVGSCPGGSPLASFDLVVQRPSETETAPIKSITRLDGGAKLKYQPKELFGSVENDAQISLITIPNVPTGVLGVLEAQPAGKPAEWVIPSRAAAVALVYGPQGLDLQKLAELMRKDSHLISQLAEYAEKSAQTEMLMETVRDWEKASSGQSLEAALQGLSARSGVAYPTLNRADPMDQQALTLMRALHPALSGFDPLAPTPGQRVQQSAGLAAAMAGLFFGNTVGMASMGGAMFLNVRSMLFPGSEFRSALAQQTGDSMVLCAKRDPAKSRMRPVYMWAWRIQGPPPPKLEGLPLRVNLGQSEWTLRLQGSNLANLRNVTTDVGKSEYRPEEAELKLTLPAAAKRGDTVALKLEVEDYPAPIQLNGAVQILGPRPKLSKPLLSRPRELSLALGSQELPANAQTAVSFTTENSGNQPVLHLACKEEATKRIAVRPGQSVSGLKLSQVSKANLFLTLDASQAGLPACNMAAQLETEDGISEAVDLGSLVRLPRLERFELTAEMAGPQSYQGWVEGEELELIEKSGWDAENGLPVAELPTPVAGTNGKQRLKIAMPWPPPAPKSALYVWLRGEVSGRRSNATY